jgi:aminopeptidase N
MFDQPNLKATYELTCSHPEDWRVLSNSPAINSKEGDKMTKFTRTEVYSTYLFVICAGPFKEIPCEREYRVPMSCYVRESLFEHLKI